MAREGAQVTVSDVEGSAVQETVDFVRGAGGKAVAVFADVTCPQQVEAMVASALSAYGRLDCAFNNAGIAPSYVGAGGTKVGDISKEAWDRMIAVNLTGVWLCMKYEIAAMEKSGGGSIVNTSSIAGLVGLPGSNAYVAGKHGVIGLTKAASIDHSVDGIRVNSICPGYIKTQMITEAFARRGEQIMTSVPMGRLGVVDEIAEAVIWLCSDRSSFVTGTALAVDGGYTAG
jgi:NAD(P)-dependent dehydrogenase (short-subunit alcohol dehydrogenase family)